MIRYSQVVLALLLAENLWVGAKTSNFLISGSFLTSRLFHIVTRYFGKIPLKYTATNPFKAQSLWHQIDCSRFPRLDTCQNFKATIGQLVDYINLSPFYPRDKIAYFRLFSCHIYHTCSCISSGSISAGRFSCEIFTRRNFIPLQVGHGRTRAQSPERCVKVIECSSQTAGQCETRGYQRLFLRCEY